MISLSYRRSRHLTISPERQIVVLIADKRLASVDAMWINDHGNVSISASQLHRTAGFKCGVTVVKSPIVLYQLAIGAKLVGR